MSLEYIQNIQGQVDKNEILKILRGVLAAELIAIHLYNSQAVIVQGVHRDDIIKEFRAHSDEEIGHMQMVMNRILQLGGNPELDPMTWNKHSQCDYTMNTSWDEKDVLELAIAGEKCAIQRYTEAAEFVKTRDVTTHHILLKLIDSEMEHVRDLSALLDQVTGDDKRKADAEKNGD